MTLQRRRGRSVVFHTVQEAVDRRGNAVQAPTGPSVTLRAWVVPERGSRAELPGQQQVKIIKLGTTDDVAGISLWSRAEWDGHWWDVVVPPESHYGSRHVRHWTITLRWRPDSDGGI